jgi:hypothetical protein
LTKTERNNKSTTANSSYTRCKDLVELPFYMNILLKQKICNHEALHLVKLRNVSGNFTETIQTKKLQYMTMKFIYTLTLIFAIVFANAQTSKLIVNQNIDLPKDSIETKSLISSLDNFLTDAQKPNEENKYILPTEKVETFIQLDEVNGIEKSGKYKDNLFYKPYLTNVVSIEKDKYLVKVAYIGVNEKTPILC